MQLYTTKLDKTAFGVTELSIGSNQDYINAAVAASAEESGFLCIVGTNFVDDPDNEREAINLPNQTFLAVAYGGLLINNTLAL